MTIMLIAITLVSVIVAVTMSALAWRMAREERRRSEARVATLAADIRGAYDPSALRADAIEPTAKPDLPLREAPASSNDLFAPAQAMPARSPLAAFVMLGALIVGSVAAVAIVFTSVGSGSPSAIDTRPVPRVRPQAPAVSAPLELIALGHERDADGLTVRGVLRNPSTGVQVRQLTAVVLLFNRDGGLVASGRTPVQATTLDPGGETTFVITVPGATDVERYRVSFRTEDHVVPHVDARS